MAQKIETTLVDDLDGTEAAETVLFGLDGVSYEVDLSAHNADGLRGALGEFVHAARKLGRFDKSRTTRATNGVRPRADREQTQAIRAWAQANPTIVGFTVGDRGRVPEGVYKLYDAHAGRSAG